MKKLVLIVSCMLPLLGCASLTDHIVPGRAPDDALSYIDGDEVTKSGMFGLYTCKADLLLIKDKVATARQRRVLSLQQQADSDGLNYGIATRTIDKSISVASDLQRNYIDPAVNGTAAGLMGLLGLGAGARFIKRPSDIPIKEHEDKVKQAANPVISKTVYAADE